MIPKFISKNQIPHKPGVYQFKNSKGTIIYVGKAIDLHSRVSSYFSGPHLPRTVVMVSEIRDLETIIVESELEALILEANLIKKYLPLYNIKLTDDKDYLYIGITKEQFPRIITARRAGISELKEYFGPFPSSTTVKSTLKRLRRVFPWCSNPPKIESSRQNLESRLLTLETRHYLKPCFYRHLGLCPGACDGGVTQADYQKIIKRFSKFMNGKLDDLTKELTQAMEESAKKLEFEKAQNLKKTLIGIEYLISPNRIESYLANPNFLEDQNIMALKNLQIKLKLPKIPTRIECFDISNIGGKDATGSMVVLTNGEIDKTEYRKFKIKISGQPNDVGMMKEMINRRLTHKEWPLPELIIVDGGRAQVRGAKLEIINLKLKIPVFGLAKREEWLYTPGLEIIKLSKSSLAIRLLQKIRNEAHRFAVSYHRRLRSRSVFV